MVSRGFPQSYSKGIPSIDMNARKHLARVILAIQESIEKLSKRNFARTIRLKKARWIHTFFQKIKAYRVMKDEEIGRRYWNDVA